MLKYLNICEEDKCVGCGACIRICPKNIIRFKKNKRGEIIPFFDDEKCVECGLCKTTCPMCTQVEYLNNQKVYAAYANVNEVRKKSASGGVAYTLAEYIIDIGGVVYGAAFTQGMNVEHIKVDNKDDLKRIQGSKYVKSSLEQQFSSVAEDLLNHKIVLFTGTPCQVAAVKQYLQTKNIILDNLILVDLICHGTPNEDTFQKALQYEVGHDNLSDCNISFRDEEGFNIKVKDKAGNIISKRNLKNSLYYNGFIEGYIYRKNCYECKFATSSRVGDITLGDFWGLGKTTFFPGEVKGGINLVMINSSKGNKLFEMIKGKLSIWERTLEEAIDGNGQLRHPVEKTKEAEKFHRLSEKKGIIYALKWCKPKKTFILFIRAKINQSGLGAILKKLPVIGKKL